MYRILIVEDEALEREAIEYIVTSRIKEAHIVGATDNGNEALDIIEKNIVDLIFMDIKIPGENGIILSRKIKDKYPDIAIIIITAHDEFEFAYEAIKVKVDDYLLKPVRPSKIEEMVRLYGKKLEKKDYIGEHINKIKLGIMKQSYMETSNAIKICVEDVYQKNSENRDIQAIIIDVERVIEGIIGIGEKIELNNIQRVRDKAEYILREYQMYTKKYDIICNLIELINIIFTEIIEKNNVGSDIEDIINYIELNIKKNISLDEVASHVNLSPYYLSKLFKREKGIKFINYVTDRKIEIAKEMIEHTDMPILNVSNELGYNEPNYFNKVFKKQTGCSPSKYRENYLKNKGFR